MRLLLVGGREVGGESQSWRLQNATFSSERASLAMDGCGVGLGLGVQTGAAS